MNRNKPFIFRFAALVVAFVIPFNAPAQTADVKEIWSLIRIGDQPVGYLREVVSSDGTGRITTSADSIIVINRLSSRVEVSQKSRIEESADGSFLKARGETSSSKQVTVLEATKKEGTLEIQTSSGGKSYARSLPVTGKIIGPEGARKLAVDGLKQSGDEISYRSFVPELAGVAGINRKALAHEAIQLDGETVPVIKVEEQIENYPIKRTLWLDGEGRVVRYTEPGPFGVVEIIRSDREAAINSAAAGGSLPQEMYDRTLVRSNIRLPHPRSIEKVTIRITHRSPELGWPRLDSEYQKVISQDRTTTILEVRRPRLEKNLSIPAHPSRLQREYLAPNAVLQSDAPQVQEIARLAAGEEKNALKAAEKLQQWVSQNMRLDLGIAVAPATEVARDRSGTCVAFSILLSSLERAKGIPSRVAMGFVYTNGIWGGHAWSEILIGDQWIPLDAVMYSPGIADAARFKFQSGTLESGTEVENASAQQMYGHIDVTLLEYTIDGRRVVVPEGAKPFSTQANEYRNPWLGFSISKPEGFQFAQLDAVWPNTNLLEMRGPKGERVSLSMKGISAGPDSLLPEAYLKNIKIDGVRSEKKIAGRAAAVVAASDKAALSFIDGTTVWILAVEGSDAPKLLDKVAASWKWIASSEQSARSLR